MKLAYCITTDFGKARLKAFMLSMTASRYASNEKPFGNSRPLSPKVTEVSARLMPSMRPSNSLPSASSNLWNLSRTAGSQRRAAAGDGVLLVVALDLILPVRAAVVAAVAQDVSRHVHARLHEGHVLK